MIETIFFDLDGTLLPMDNDVFTKGYFKMLAAKLVPYGYEPNRLIEVIWAGTKAMVENDGAASNETVFWKTFAAHFGEESLQHKPVFESFYANEFQAARQFCGYAPEAKEIVNLAKSRGFRLGVASNPLFPLSAMKTRIRWADCRPEDFELCTCYESVSYAKPNPEFYREIARRMNCPPEHCLMVGNDIEEDMVAAQVGMQVFLLTEELHPAYPGGDYRAIYDFIKDL